MSRKSHWDLFWQKTKTLSSFSEGDVALGYTGELLNFWHQHFSLLYEGAVVVDIGTGNGALAYAAQQYAIKHKNSYQIHATDIASIDPVALFKDANDIQQVLKYIIFHPETETEALPFEQESIDLITSQFALEYTEIDRALQECLRVLKSGGRLVAVLHHSQSAVAKDTAAGRQFFARCLLENDLFVPAEQLIELGLQLQADIANRDIAAKYEQVNQALLQQVAAIKEACSPMELAWFNDFIRQIACLLIEPQSGHIDKLADLKQSVSALYCRLQDQHAAELSEEDVEAWSALISALGIIDFKFKLLSIDEELFGWVLEIVK